MPNGNEWYGGRLPGWDWWRNWAYGGPATRQYPRELPGMQAPYGGGGRYGRAAGDPYGPQWNRMAARRPQGQPMGQPGVAPTPTGLAPGQYTPSQGFGQIPYQGIQGPYGGARATPGDIPIYQRGMTLVEEALARVSELAGQQPAEPERPEVQFPGYWEAIGQQPGNYPVPQGAVQGMWGPRRPWEEWSWRTRGTPLQGHEILRVEGGRMPWGGRRREPALDPRGRRIGPLSIRGGGGRAEREQGEAWQPGAWGGTF